MVCFEERPAAKVRLLCFPHAGGSATAFMMWHRELPKDIEVRIVQLPGRDERRKEPHRVEMKALVAELVGALAGAHDRFVALFGYSLGAIVAFEYARAIRRIGAGEPEHLFVAARKAPQLPGDPLSGALSDDDFVREVTRRYEGIPKMILDDPELLSFFLPTIRADVALLESYVYEPEPPLACPITAFGGTTDPNVSKGALEAWRAQTSSRFEAMHVPGGHFFIAQARKAVLETIRTTLL
jgi:medium-chain acyl-[acyl-carrier-protein] hydrolase